jgi:hypothetical protein
MITYFFELKKSLSIFKEANTIQFSECNSVAIVVLYDDCLEKIEFEKTEEIAGIVEKLSLSEDDKQTLIEIYIMLIKHNISMSFDSYQSLDILNTQMKLIIHRIIFFLIPKF